MIIFIYFIYVLQYYFMAVKKNDEWGIIIQKQLELDTIRNHLEKNRLKLQQEAYRNELDALAKIKQGQKDQEKIQKLKEAQEISERVRMLSDKEQEKRHRQLEENQRIIEENIELEKLLNKRKYIEKLQSKSQDIDMNIKENEKILENLSKRKALKQQYENTIDIDMKYAQEKHYMEKNKGLQEKEKELQNIRLEQERLAQRDAKYKGFYARVQENQNKKMEAFTHNVAPKMFEKEINYMQ